MPRFIITPDFTAQQLSLSNDEAAVYTQLCQQRQCTSAELISRCKISNPHALIEQINSKLVLAQSQWQIASSAPKAPQRGPTQSMRTPVGYYRLLRKAALSSVAST